MNSLGPNVHVIRHGSLLWSHHDKIVVVDRNTAFVGGIDLCFGRADDPNHKLTDLLRTPDSDPVRPSLVLLVNGHPLPH